MKDFKRIARWRY